MLATQAAMKSNHAASRRKYSPTDIPNAAQAERQTSMGYHIVVGAADKKVYFYNSKGVLGPCLSTSSSASSDFLTFA